jgi:hypothetical protein
MWEDCHYVVNYIDEARLVVLEGIDKRSKSLIYPLVRILSLSISLGVISRGELKLCP